jgi:hypothetical protein
MRKLRQTLGILLSAGAAILCIGARPAAASIYNVTFNDGNEGNWQTLYAQGFNTQLGASPTPGASVGDTVDLTSFSFFKSGTADSASNIQVAIFNTMYPNTVGLTTSSSSFVGLSTTTLASTASIATDAPEAFNFNNLPLVYGNDYMAMFCNVDGSGNITPVLVSAMAVNYSNTSPYLPASGYGTQTQYNYVTSNYISGGYFSAFSYAGDAAFSASLSTVPEPASLSMLGIAALAVLKRRPR